MIWALDARLELSFTRGLVAAINPCGFVLLPTYLIYFLGMENLRPGAERASVRRALLVGLSVTAGFMSVFAIIGGITFWGTDWLLKESEWLSLGIGVALVALGIAMLFGYRLPFTVPKLDVGERDRSVRSMFVFGIAYAVASLGCTLPLFVPIVFGGLKTDGVGTALGSAALYGLGMGLLVTGLTVSLALANTAVLRILRSGMAWFEYLAGAFVLLTGLYLTYYWFTAIRDDVGGDKVIGRAETWQSRLSEFVQRNQTTIVVLAVAVIAGAIVTSLAIRRTKTVDA